MPIVEIQALPQAGVDTSAVLRAVCVELASEMGVPARGVWATWRPLEAGAYAEGDDAPEAQPRDTHPPLVRVIGFKGRTPEQVEGIIECIARVLGRELGLGDNVFVVFEEGRSGRVFTGGAVVKVD
jgi:phenylpyruvate tautomerase PptA (4-oxalocrotonate tautomerase family)